jgi:CBS domain-containing protein
MLQGHKVSELMTRECLMVNPEMTVEQLVNENILASGRRCFPVVENGKVIGMVTIHNVRTIHRDEWRTKTVKDAMTPFDKLKWVRPDQDLSTVLEILTESDINQVPVVEDNIVVGIIARDRLLNFVSIRGELGM